MPSENSVTLSGKSKASYNSSLAPYVVTVRQTLRDAWEKIDQNKSGFVLILQDDATVAGVLTDGDIRRSLLRDEKDLSASVSLVMQTSFVSVMVTDSFEKVVEVFKSDKIQFLPILDENGRLSNLVTKRRFHALMHRGEIYRPDLDFSRVDTSTLDQEIFGRPWGFYKTTFLNEKTRAKVLQVLPGEELSLQEHQYRDEYWVIVAGSGVITLGAAIRSVRPGDFFFIPRGCKHQIKNTSETEVMMISEVQLGEAFDEQDIIRYSDKYNRA